MILKKKNDKGITLVFLVITIVIMLILAGVAISLVIGKNGLFNKSKESSEKYKNSAEVEKTDLDKAADEVNGLMPVDNNDEEDIEEPVDINKLYLFKEGKNGANADQCISVTGGWSTIANQDSNGYGSTTITSFIDIISGDTQDTSDLYSGAYTNNVIDTTGYTKLCYEAEEDFIPQYGYGTCIFMGLRNSKITGYGSIHQYTSGYMMPTHDSINTKTVHTINLNSGDTNKVAACSIEREEYAVNHHINMKVYNVWLEK